MAERVERRGDGGRLEVDGASSTLPSGSVACGDDRHSECPGISNTGGRCACACHGGRVDRLDQGNR